MIMKERYPGEPQNSSTKQEMLRYKKDRRRLKAMQREGITPSPEFISEIIKRDEQLSKVVPGWFRNYQDGSDLLH